MVANLSRRQLLRSLGVSTAAAPLLPFLDRTARADDPPRRLLLVFSPCGAHKTRYWPTGAETDFRFPAGSILEPLDRHRNKLIIPKNVKRVFAPEGGDHERGIGCLWTGASLNPGNGFGGRGYPGAASIDQLLGKALPLETDFRTLEVSVQHDGPGQTGDTMVHMCYAGSDQPVTPSSSPYKLFDRLMGGDGGTSVTPQSLARLRAERQSVIDLVRGELKGLETRIDRDDRIKIAKHLEGIRSIEQRLQKPVAQTPSQSCARQPDGQLDVNANDNFPALVKLQSDLVVSALACDRTRIATLQWSRALNYLRHNWIGISDLHHDVSHDQTPTGIDNLTTINRWYAEQFAYLLGELDKVQEGNGTLLDNTLVVYAHELSPTEVWVHDPNPMCVVMAGGLGGRLSTGRFPDYNQQYDWNQMLVTICQAMGANIDKVGDLGGSGPIPGLITA